MPNRRGGAPGSFGAPLDKIVTSFPADGARAAFKLKEPQPSTTHLSREEFGATIRAAFLLIDRVDER
ncbi:MAG: hypothetical protein ABIQ32_06890 [Sphingomicrobium sp.]